MKLLVLLAAWSPQALNFRARFLQLSRLRSACESRSPSSPLHCVSWQRRWLSLWQQLSLPLHCVSLQRHWPSLSQQPYLQQQFVFVS